jgi:dihydroorotate dehydrogenase
VSVLSTFASSLFDLAQPLLRHVDPERAHSLALQSLRISNAFSRSSSEPMTHGLTTNCLGLVFPTPLGLAAGCDKNGDFIDALGAIGFGFIEIGTVTPRPQFGSPRPRLFRVPCDLAVINRMGFNNRGIDYVVAQLQRRTFAGICGVNIGKNAETPNDNAADDYLTCFRAVYKHADYVTINISSPNTPGLRALQSTEGLRRIAGALLSERHALERQHDKRVPVLVKIAPDLNDAEIRAVSLVVRELGIDGVVATNTTTDLGVLSQSVPSGATGGVSGRPLLVHSLRVVRRLRASLGANTPIVGVGGITDSVAAQRMLHAGANLIQIYTGFVYKGPGLLREVYEGMHRARGT